MLGEVGILLLVHMELEALGCRCLSGGFSWSGWRSSWQGCVAVPYLTVGKAEPKEVPGWHGSSRGLLALSLGLMPLAISVLAL